MCGRACRDTPGLRWGRDDVTRTLIFILWWFRETERESEGEKGCGERERETGEGEEGKGREEKREKGREERDRMNRSERDRRERECMSSILMTAIHFVCVFVLSVCREWQ